MTHRKWSVRQRKAAAVAAAIRQCLLELPWRGSGPVSYEPRKRTLLREHSETAQRWQLAPTGAEQGYVDLHPAVGKTYARCAANHLLVASSHGQAAIYHIVCTRVVSRACSRACQAGQPNNPAKVFWRIASENQCSVPRPMSVPDAGSKRTWLALSAVIHGSIGRRWPLPCSR